MTTCRTNSLWDERCWSARSSDSIEPSVEPSLPRDMDGWRGIAGQQLRGGCLGALGGGRAGPGGVLHHVNYSFSY